MCEMEIVGRPMEFVFQRTLAALHLIQQGIRADSSTPGISHVPGRGDDQAVEVTALHGGNGEGVVPFIRSCFDDHGLVYEQQTGGAFRISACSSVDRSLH
jgi:hypothetical protein